MTMGPCHLYFVITDGAGNQSHSAKVDVVYPGTNTPVTQPLFTDQGMLSPAASSNLTVPGIISLWTTDPLRVDLVIRSFDVGNQNIFGLDFLYPGVVLCALARRDRVTAALALSTLLHAGNIVADHLLIPAPR